MTFSLPPYWELNLYGGNNRARTYDPLLVRQMLSQLSYAPECKKEEICISSFFVCGADYGARTRHLDLGKVALYQMS